MNKGARTRAEILTIGMQVWREQPDRVNASYIASLLGITHAAVRYHFGTTDKLRTAIAAEALKRRDAVIIPQLIVTGHPIVAGMSAEDRAIYLANV